MDEAELRQLATRARANLHSLIPDPVVAGRVDAELARALALPEGQAKSALRTALSSHPAVRAWLREQGVSRDTSWRLLPEPAEPDESPADAVSEFADESAADAAHESAYEEAYEDEEPVLRYAGNGGSEYVSVYRGLEALEDPSQYPEPQDDPDSSPPPTPVWTGGGPASGPGLLGDDDDDADEAAPPPDEPAEQPDQRFFVAELEDHPRDQPLKTGEEYTIAFSVGTPPPSAIATTPFGDEILAAAWMEVEELELTVQLDSDDFEIGDSTRPLRVPRTGKSRGKARFDIAPRHDGECRLVASVHYQGNFVQQMDVTILVGGTGRPPVAVSGRGRWPNAAATLEPRDIAIVLEPAPASGFKCTVMASVIGHTILPITATELALAVDVVRQAMMSVISAPQAGELVFQTGVDIPGPARDSALRTLARAGARLFQQLFFHPGAGADARTIGEWLRDQATDPECRLKVQVVADQAPLPWALLYLGDASEGADLDWNYFLGMRHIVEQLPLQQSLNTRGNRIPSEPSLAVSVNVNTSIDSSMGITLVAGHQQHWRDTAVARHGLALVSRSTKTEVVRALASGNTTDQVVYFYCHATAGSPTGGPGAAQIIMGRNDKASLDDLNLDAPTTIQLAGNPLVFINACESADLSPLFYNGFVPYFMAKGARGVIGTECKTPVLFAIEWANAFFDRFLDGTTVGETVLELRQQFLREHGNPLGLIYAVHCDADTRVAPALAPAQQL